MLGLANIRLIYNNIYISYLGIIMRILLASHRRI